jgi:hypothetical protein
MPATNRLDILRPRLDFSEKERSALFVESAMKKERSNAEYLAMAGQIDGATRLDLG